MNAPQYRIGTLVRHHRRPGHGNVSCIHRTSRQRSLLACWLTAVGGVVLGMVGQGFAMPVVGTWNTHAPMTSGRQQHSTAAVGDKLYVVGGATMLGPSAVLEIYDSSTNMWSSGASLPLNQGVGAAVEIGGQVYYAGGCRNSDCGPTLRVLDTLQRYDPNTDMWTSLASSPTKHGAGPAAAVINDKMYLVGGISTGFTDVPSGTPNPALEIFDPGTGMWTTGTNIPTPVEGGVAGAIDGKLYIAGGYDRTGGMVIDTLQIYDTGTGLWSTGAPLPGARQFSAGGVIDGIFYVTGGSDGAGVLQNDLFAYDPITNTWDSGPVIPTPRRTFSAGVIGGSLYAVGGFDGAVWNALESFTPPAAESAGAIPEPGMLTLLAIGGLGLSCCRRKASLHQRQSSRSRMSS